MASQSFLVKGETFRDMSLAYVHPYQEGLLYLFFGGLTFLISVLSYMLLAETMGLRPVLSNLLSWVLAVLFAFFTNKTWVFTQASTYEASTSMQFLKFSGARVLTLLIEEVMLWFFVEKMAWSNLGIKIIAQIIVISLNYVLSKVWIFEK
jgi:putative flippase GtrA